MKLDKRLVVQTLEAEYMTGQASLKTIAATFNCTPQRLNQIGIEFIRDWRNAAKQWQIRGRSASFRSDNGGGQIRQLNEEGLSNRSGTAPPPPQSSKF